MDLDPARLLLKPRQTGESESSPMLIAHLIHRLDIGGLEKVVADLVNHLPHDRFDHAVISLTEITAFKERLHHPRVTFHALGKQRGQDPAVWWRYWKLLRQLKPDLVHACNLATLEAAIPTRLAGVKRFIHAEHGRDSHDPDGTRRKYLLLRRFLIPWVDGFVPVSRDLHDWMLHTVHIPPEKIHPIVNGVRLPPVPNRSRPGTDPNRPFTIGHVGRQWPIKDPLNLIEAFFQLRRSYPETPLRLILVGDGPERPAIEARIAEYRLADTVHLAGWQNDVTPFWERFDLFVLPSRAEGTPLTILEAMAHALPVVATRVGGVGDLVVDGQTGRLVPRSDPCALADAIGEYLFDPARRAMHGAAGRERVAARFSQERMIAAYLALFLGVSVTKDQEF
ncbi:D-inositol-3-phosphate glycosyltransferase [Candidatus Magnetaquicoccaceae bacterium FCR-1]|uniref:D-inositol-3-phosphate glycosyltransferase n=1 Tax=Candidatus Magnetaquiglobus chichijimensis TaxID=3141448 RepID=A0ABQ0C494_9PROT